MYGGSGIGFTNLYPGVGVREWQYWTRNKLEILAGYLPAFNTACQQWPDRVYIDLMAGEPVNVDPATMSAVEREATGARRLPLTLTEALDALAADQVLMTALGPLRSAAYLAVKRAEAAAFAERDAAWECFQHFLRF